MPEALAAPDPKRFDFEKLFAVPNGEELPNDAPDDDRTDAAMESRFQSYRQGEDLNWLLEATEPPARPQEAQSAETGTPRGLADAAAMDIGMGAVESPRQIVGGMRDAVQSIVDLEEEVIGLSGFLERGLPLGGVRIGSGGFDYLSPDELAAAKEAGEEELPQIGEPRTVTGGAVRSISQFLTGFRLA